MKKHEELDALVSNDETFVIQKHHLHIALMSLHECFHDDFMAGDLDTRRSIAGACLTHAMELPFDAAKDLFMHDQELHTMIDLIVSGYLAAMDWERGLS